MPTTRIPLKKRRNRRITDEAIAAWHACDWARLHEALGLAPFEMSPLPRSLSAYGCTDTAPENPLTIFDGSWEKAKALQEELMAIAGPPGRAAQ
jgi:hypothetical protein